MTAQQEYSSFLNNQLTEDYQTWLKTATAEEVNEENAKYTRLKLAAQFEANQEAIKNSELAEANRIAEREALIEKIRTDGYVGDGGVSDFERLMNKPVKYGADWQRLAKEHSDSGGLELFIMMYLNQ